MIKGTCSPFQRITHILFKAFIWNVNCFPGESDLFGIVDLANLIQINRPLH